MSETVKNVITIVALISLAVGFYYYFQNSPEQKVKRVAAEYYEALIDEDYESTFNHLYVYDNLEGHHPTEGTKLSEEDAKQFYMEKVEQLNEFDYRIKDFDIYNIRKEDGHTSFAETTLVVDVHGHTYEWKETIDEYNGEAWIVESNDPFVKFRDGTVNFDLDEAQPEYFFQDGEESQE